LYPVDGRNHPGILQFWIIARDRSRYELEIMVFTMGFSRQRHCEMVNRKSYVAPRLATHLIGTFCHL